MSTENEGAEMKQTVLHQKHLVSKPKMTDFQGWQIPLQYSDVQEEYYAVRTASGLFDVGFLGKIEVSGSGAAGLLQNVFTRNMSKLAEGTSTYGLICNESGFLISDGIVFHLQTDKHLITVNPVSTEKVLHWLKKHAAGDVQINDATGQSAHFSLQGPRSPRILEKLIEQNFKKLKPRVVRELMIADTTVLVSRVGYTGEHGYELISDPDRGETVWDALMTAGKDEGILPCGFACRDILRLEMGYLLYGNDINETRTPFEAGLASNLDFKKEFIGKDALLKMSAENSKQKLVGFELLDKGIPKSGGSIFSENREIGMVTSGGQSPHVRKGFGLGYIANRYAQPGQEIEIEVKDREIAAKIVELPFYRKK
jgi:aminomethyltransferase